jgi:hypothetical protein
MPPEEVVRQLDELPMPVLLLLIGSASLLARLFIGIVIPSRVAQRTSF